MRGGFRPGSGRPKGSTGSKRKRVLIPPAQRAAMQAAAASEPPSVPGDGVAPLEYMLAVVNDPDADPARRDRMAIAAAPFVHPRIEPVGVGKKEQKRLAAEQAAKRFATLPPPRLVVHNG